MPGAEVPGAEVPGAEVLGAGAGGFAGVVAGGGCAGFCEFGRGNGCGVCADTPSAAAIKPMVTRARRTRLL